jgi:hypothetical protein
VEEQVKLFDVQLNQYPILIAECGRHSGYHSKTTHLSSLPITISLFDSVCRHMQEFKASPRGLPNGLLRTSEVIVNSKFSSALINSDWMWLMMFLMLSYARLPAKSDM